MDKTISLDNFLSKLRDAVLVTINGHIALDYGHREELDYFSLYVNDNEVKFVKDVNNVIPVFNKDGGGYSFANLMDSDRRIVDVALFSYMQL